MKQSPEKNSRPQAVKNAVEEIESLMGDMQDVIQSTHQVVGQQFVRHSFCYYRARLEQARRYLNEAFGYE